MARKRNPPDAVTPATPPANTTPTAKRVAHEPQSPSAQAWASFVCEYNRQAAELSPHVGKPLTLGRLARGEFFPPPTDAMRANFFGKLIDDLAPLAQAGLSTQPLLERSSALACKVIEELRRNSVGLTRGPAARREQAAEKARNEKDAMSLYYKAALDYAIRNPDARRDEIVAYLQRPQLSLPPRSATTIRRYVAGAIDAARSSRARNEK